MDTYAGVTEDNMDDVQFHLHSLNVLPPDQSAATKRSRHATVGLVADKISEVIGLLSDLAIPDNVRNAHNPCFIYSNHRLSQQLPLAPGWA